MKREIVNENVRQGGLLSKRKCLTRVDAEDSDISKRKFYAVDGTPY